MEGIKEQENLKKHTTLQVGGPADYFYELKDISLLTDLIKWANERNIPYLILGGGSNIAFHDDGFRGLVIKNKSQNIAFENSSVTVDSGMTVAQLILEMVKHGYSGLEPWVGLPGTVGGAVRGNAGCNGLDTKGCLIKAMILDPITLEISEKPVEYFEYDYRHGKLKETGEICLNATFKLENRHYTPEEQKQVMKEIRSNRVSKQPFGSSVGSFFKNPAPDKPAGMLIEQAGLKGTKVGKAQISEKHANFLLNLGGATSQDIKELAKLAKAQVKAKFGIELEEEVQFISETSKIRLQ